MSTDEDAVNNPLVEFPMGGDSRKQPFHNGSRVSGSGMIINSTNAHSYLQVPYGMAVHTPQHFQHFATPLQSSGGISPMMTSGFLPKRVTVQLGWTQDGSSGTARKIRKVLRDPKLSVEDWLYDVMTNEIQHNDLKALFDSLKMGIQNQDNTMLKLSLGPTRSMTVETNIPVTSGKKSEKRKRVSGSIPVLRIELVTLSSEVVLSPRDPLFDILEGTDDELEVRVAGEGTWSNNNDESDKTVVKKAKTTVASSDSRMRRRSIGDEAEIEESITRKSKSEKKADKNSSDERPTSAKATKQNQGSGNMITSKKAPEESDAEKRVADGTTPETIALKASTGSESKANKKNKSTSKTPEAEDIASPKSTGKNEKDKSNLALPFDVGDFDVLMTTRTSRDKKYQELVGNKKYEECLDSLFLEYNQAVDKKKKEITESVRTKFFFYRVDKETGKWKKVDNAANLKKQIQRALRDRMKKGTPESKDNGSNEPEKATKLSEKKSTEIDVANVEKNKDGIDGSHGSTLTGKIGEISRKERRFDGGLSDKTDRKESETNESEITEEREGNDEELEPVGDSDTECEDDENTDEISPKLNCKEKKDDQADEKDLDAGKLVASSSDASTTSSSSDDSSSDDGESTEEADKPPKVIPSKNTKTQPVVVSSQTKAYPKLTSSKTATPVSARSPKKSSQTSTRSKPKTAFSIVEKEKVRGAKKVPKKAPLLDPNKKLKFPTPSGSSRKEESSTKSASKENSGAKPRVKELHRGPPSSSADHLSPDGKSFGSMAHVRRKYLQTTVTEKTGQRVGNK